MSDVLPGPETEARNSFGRREKAADDDSWFEELDPEDEEEWDDFDPDAEDEEGAVPRRRRSRGARRPTIVFLNFLMTCGVFGALAVGGVALYGKSAYERPGPLASDTTFVVREGATFNAVASELQKRGIIGDARIFGYAAKISRKDRAIKTGEFSMPAGASMARVMDELIDGKPVEFRVTIPEGLTVHQALARIAAHPELTGEAPSPDEIPEGMLAAETISFARGEDRQVVVDKLRRIQTERLERAWAARSSDVPLDTPDNLLTLASLVEKETAVPSERRTVAAVYSNRIRENWRLDSDPTVIYGVYGGAGLPPGKSITRSDLNDQNLYNTYRMRGLPAGPIAIPGEAALLAAANPAETEAMFFVADGTGGHIFAETLEEHNANVRKWRKIESGEVTVEVREERRSAAADAETVALSQSLTEDRGAVVESAAPEGEGETVAETANATAPSAAGSVDTGTPAPGTPVPAMRPR